MAEWPQEREYGWSVLVRMETEGACGANPAVCRQPGGSAAPRGPGGDRGPLCTLADRSQTGREITYYTAKGILLTAQGYGLLSWSGRRPSRPDRPALWSRELKDSIDRSFPGDAAPLVKALVTGNRDSLTGSLYHLPPAYRPDPHGGGVRDAPGLLAGLISFCWGRAVWLTALVLIPVFALFCLVAVYPVCGAGRHYDRSASAGAPSSAGSGTHCTALGTALFLLLLWNPYSAAHIGLQPPFAAVAGIPPVRRQGAAGLLALLPAGCGKGLLAARGGRSCISQPPPVGPLWGLTAHNAPGGPVL